MENPGRKRKLTVSDKHTHTRIHAHTFSSHSYTWTKCFGSILLLRGRHETSKKRGKVASSASVWATAGCTREKTKKTKDCYMNNLSLGDTVEIKAKNKFHDSPLKPFRSIHGLTGCGLICFLRLSSSSSSPLLFFIYFSILFIRFHLLRSSI